MRYTIAQLQASTDSASASSARGTVNTSATVLDPLLRSLRCCAAWCPSGTSPQLLATSHEPEPIRVVTLSQVVPMPVEEGPVPFNTYKYNMSVIGRYDQIGQFLADVASLQRIIVPYDLTLDQANSNAAKALGDTTGALLEAKFQVRTFVKTPTPEGQASGS